MDFQKIMPKGISIVRIVPGIIMVEKDDVNQRGVGLFVVSGDETPDSVDVQPIASMEDLMRLVDSLIALGRSAFPSDEVEAALDRRILEGNDDEETAPEGLPN